MKSSHLKRTILPLIVGTLLSIGIGSAIEGILNPYLYSIVIYASVNIILAVSLNLVIGLAGQFSMGHAGFMAVGAYA